jgi:hypothetical protein
MKVDLKYLLFASALLVQGVFAGMALEADATCEEETNAAIAMIAAGGAMMITIVGIPIGLGMIAADNGDGSRNCWTTAVHPKEIADAVARVFYEKHGIPVEELLKHVSVQIRGPDSPRKFVVRNRHGAEYNMRATGKGMVHIETIPKEITEHGE